MSPRLNSMPNDQRGYRRATKRPLAVWFTSALAIGLLVAESTVAQQYGSPNPYPCPYPSGAAPAQSVPYYTPTPGQQPYVSPSPTPAPAQTAPGTATEPMQPRYAPPSFDSGDVMPPDLADFGGTSGMGLAMSSTTPEIMGDRFGTSGGTPVTIGSQHFLMPSTTCGGTVGRIKLSENTSPIPRDRIFFNYSYFDDVPLLIEGVSVDRYTLGVEKTFFCGAMSFEVKAPVACTLDNDIVLGRDNDDNNYVFGNIYATVKALLAQGDEASLSMGVTVEVPTAEDINLLHSSGATLIHFENNSTFIAPFVGGLWDPDDSPFFVQAIVQWDIDSTGSPVYVNSSPFFPTRGTLDRAGRFTEATWQYNDVSLGYWVLENYNPCATLNGLAVITEFHYNVMLNDEDQITHTTGTQETYQIGSGGHRDNLNVLVGLAARMQNLSLGVGYGFPIGNGVDQEFDGEIRAYANFYFGRTGNDSMSVLD